ncbi:MAG: glycoside hydrolase family 31 protein [Lachnospiraceae bacterium]|nr:glycoside hydrolase family 31 protein [Lachnospiraceae bacterium]
MGRIIIEEKRLIYRRKDELTVIEPYGANCLRCRSTKNGTLLDENWTVLPPASADACVTSGNEKKATITNGLISATIEAGQIWYGGLINYYRDGKPILRTKFEGDYYNRNQHVEGDHYRIQVIFEPNEGEHFYGMGQEQVDLFDRKGSTCQIIHYNTKSTLPVLYSSLGYGFFWNNPAPGRCETTRNHTMFVADSAYQADYFVYAGQTPAETMRIYCDLTGHSPRLPRWAAGYWQCKLRYESQEDLLSVAREYKKRGIPIDAIVIDYFHWTEQGEWKFDPKYWPDPKAMVEELKEMGIELVVSIWPTINPKSENYLEMSENNMLIRTENGQYGTFDFYGQQTFIDVLNPETRAFVWNKVKENYYKYGIKTFWLDEAEPEVHPQQPSHLKYHLGNGAQVAQLYPYYYAKTFYDGLTAEGEAPISLTRAAYPGSQKFGAIVWNGDIPSTFEALKMSIKSGLSMGMCGIPWWNSDIGGFLFGDIESDYFRELIVRWFQFGLFCPIMRLHGARKKQSTYQFRHPGIIEPSGGDNEIWCFGERNYPIIKNLIELREKLKDYTLKYTDEAAATGAPIMRPMFWEYPNDEKCYELEDQYFYGSDILFAPIYLEGCTEREVYLPEGNWINALTKEKVSGGQTITCHAEIDEFIAFVREGSEVLSCF